MVVGPAAPLLKMGPLIVTIPVTTSSPALRHHSSQPLLTFRVTELHLIWQLQLPLETTQQLLLRLHRHPLHRRHRESGPEQRPESVWVLEQGSLSLQQPSHSYSFAIGNYRTQSCRTAVVQTIHSLGGTWDNNKHWLHHSNPLYMSWIRQTPSRKNSIRVSIHVQHNACFRYSCVF